MKTLDSILKMFQDLYDADGRLQVAMRDLLGTYFQFMHAPRKNGQKVLNRLVLRHALDRQGRIRRLFWTKRTRAQKKIGLRKIHLSTRLIGPFQAKWIYIFARDWSRRTDYYAFENRRKILNSTRSSLVGALRSLRLSFQNAWGPKASPEDRSRVDRAIRTRASQFQVPDYSALVGAAAFCRAVRGVENELGLLIDDFRRHFHHRVEVDFEPALRLSENGTFRLYWGFPDRVHTASGTRTFTQYIPGRPTDAWMRTLRIREGTRKEVLAFTKKMLPLQARHRELVAYLGVHRQRVNELLSRMERTLPAPHEEALRLTKETRPVPNRALF